MNRPLIHCALLALLTLLPSGHAFAFCSPFTGHIRVGADSAHCQANDIQSAINMAGVCPVVIDITREHTYTNQQLTINDKYITFQGWGDGVTCADIPNEFGFPSYTPPASTAPLVTLNGSGGGRVLTITGNSNVGLHNLTITGGQTDDGASGGGISFDGQGSLYLINSLINLNHGGFGGAINVNGSSGPTNLFLMDYTQILANTAAVSGGGIRIEGSTRMYALRPSTWIGFNHAPNGYGGGLEVLGPARADIGSPGYNGVGVISYNDAAYGGGIDILTFNDQADAIVRLFTTDPNNPVQISSNSASHTGGAVYLKPWIDGSGSGYSMLCAYDFRMNNNVAQEGAAIYGDADYSLNYTNGAEIALNANPLYFGSGPAPACVLTEPPTALGAVACKAGVPCNEFVGNTAANQSGQPTAGSTILLQSFSDLEGDRFSARHNAGAHVLRELGNNNTTATLTNCLFADNTLTQELIALTDGDQARLSVNSCTVAGNMIGAPYAFLAPRYFSLKNSIVDQPGRATVDPAITDGNYAAHVLTNDRSTLPDTVYIHLGAPSFIDAAHGDYHLMHSSLGVDNAPVDPKVPGLDLDRRTRVVDLPDMPNAFGPMDLGAYEVQLACAGNDTIFCNGFDG
jgi:predicted outer membrane repeat protein